MHKSKIDNLNYQVLDDLISFSNIFITLKDFFLVRIRLTLTYKRNSMIFIAPKDLMKKNHKNYKRMRKTHSTNYNHTLS